MNEFFEYFLKLDDGGYKVNDFGNYYDYEFIEFVFGEDVIYFIFDFVDVKLDVRVEGCEIDLFDYDF